MRTEEGDRVDMIMRDTWGRSFLVYCKLPVQKGTGLKPDMRQSFFRWVSPNESAHLHRMQKSDIDGTLCHLLVNEVVHPERIQVDVALARVE